MSVGAWDPNQATGDGFNIDMAILERFISLSENDQLDNLTQQLDDELINRQASLMKQEKNRWVETAAQLSSEQILHLIRFFTLAEMQLSGWEAGSESPVIWLTKILRQRKQPLDRDMLLWIRANSDNRFIPNGAL